ncbi:MAG: heparinase II/III family protein [Verrucomicrobiota bacterium]
MQNLLLPPPDESQIAAILAETAGRPALPPLGAPEWTALRGHPAVAAWLTPLLARADAEADESLPALTDKLYADFFKTGDRLPFERPYFERRRRLGRAAIAVLLGDDAVRARLLPSFLQKLTAILDEESWSLPAHVWTEPTGKNPWMIDLFAAETANNLAEILVVLAVIIPDQIAHRIKTRLRTQIFENYVEPRAPFTWLQITNNWNAVCHQGVLGAALAIEDDHALVARMLTLAATRLPRYLEGFGDDGSTSEGPGYWSYGFGWFTELNAQLEHRTAGRLSLFEGDPKIARIARFAPLMCLAGGHMVNFSDGSRTGRLSAPLLACLGQRLDDPMLAAEGAAAYRHQAAHGLNLDDLRRDFFNLTRLALRTPPAAPLADAPDTIRPDAIFPDYGALVARGTDDRGHRWELAAKGGHNAEHHNHNDCGSWLLNIDGAPAIIEIGAPEYTRAFFGDHRYENLAARSLGHSVPFVNNREQPAGREFAADVLHAETRDDHAAFAVDLTRCYPPEANCARLHRAWTLDKTAGHLTVSDTYRLTAPGPVETMIICPGSVTRDGPDAIITTPTVRLRLTPRDNTLIAAIETCDYRDHHGNDAQVTRIRLQPAPAKPAETPADHGVLACSLRIA